MNRPQQQSPDLADAQKSERILRKVAAWTGAAVIVASVVACVVMAMLRSEGVTSVTVTALEGTTEPRDHILPFVKQKESLPDYEIVLHLTNGQKIRLGTKPDTLADKGLTWQLSEPVCIADISGVRLREADKLISDDIAEVQITAESVTDKGYRFDFSTERSTSVAVQSFFKTPIGNAIAAAFFVAVLLLLLSAFVL